MRAKVRRTNFLFLSPSGEAKKAFNVLIGKLLVKFKDKNASILFDVKISESA